jgi:hypothetical protein
MCNNPTPHLPLDDLTRYIFWSRTNLQLVVLSAFSIEWQFPYPIICFLVCAVQCSPPSFTFSHHTITFAEVVDFPRICFGLGLGSGTFAFELHGFSRCRVVINIDCFLELFSPCRDRLLFVRFKVTLALMVVISPLSPQACTLFTIHVTHKTARPSLGQRHRPEIHTITWRYLLVFSVSLAFLLLPIICVPFSCSKQSLSGWWISKSFCSFHLSSRKRTNRPHRIMHTSKFSCVKAPWEHQMIELIKKVMKLSPSMHSWVHEHSHSRLCGRCLQLSIVPQHLVMVLAIRCYWQFKDHPKAHQACSVNRRLLLLPLKRNRPNQPCNLCKSDLVILLSYVFTSLAILYGTFHLVFVDQIFINISP